MEEETADRLKLAAVVCLLLGILIADVHLASEEARRMAMLKGVGLGGPIGFVAGPMFFGGSGFSGQANASGGGLLVGGLVGALLGGLLAGV